MNKTAISICTIAILCVASKGGRAQNWVLTIQDPVLGTSINQVNGVTGGTGVLFGSFLNFTGTVVSDDGGGNPALPTLMDFAGFGFVQSPGQYDLGSLFVPDAPIPAYPQVSGSSDGSTPGSTSFLPLGSFDLTGLPAGMYQEDFQAAAYPDDFNSTVPFNVISGTLTLDVVDLATPEPGPWSGTVACILAITSIWVSRLRTLRGAKARSGV